MISCRSLIRVDTVWKFANPFVKSNPVLPYLQRCRFYNGFSCYLKIDGARDMQSVMDRKKRKTVTSVRRPVSTRSTSHEVSLVTHVKAESQNIHNSNDGISEIGIQVEEVKLEVSNDRHACDEIEVLNEAVDPNLSSTTLQDSGEGKAPEGGCMPSTEKHSVSVEAGASLIRFIKGKGGSTQKKIEEELGVEIIFPSSKKEDYITIEGDSTDNLAKALEKIKGIIDEAVQSRALDYSHFVSLPLAIHPELVDKLVNFQTSILGINNSNPVENLDSGGSNEDTSDEEDVDPQLNEAPHVAVELKTEEDNEHVKVAITNIPIVSYPPKASKSSKSSALEDLGIDKSIFIKPETFHLTVLMLKLWNKDRVDAAAEVLQSVSSKVMDALDGRPVSVRLKGLTTMRGSLAKARVLYAPVEEVGGEDRLMRACQVIIDEFVQAGLVLEKDAQQKLKLHVTVMNARHRKRKKWTRRADSFDARGIVKQYGAEEWGEYVIREAHLSQRFAFDEKGYYHCRASTPFPENMQLD